MTRNMHRQNMVLLIVPALTVCLLFVAASPPARCADVRLTARIDRDHVMVYDRIQYTLTLEADRRGVPDPTPPDFNGFKQLGAPRTSTQFSWVNGRTTSTKVYTYFLQAQKPGRFTISPARVTVDGQIYQSTPLQVVVAKPGTPRPRETGDEDAFVNVPEEAQGSLFLRAVVDENNPYVGQAVTVSYFLYTRVRIRDYGMQQMPEYEGFWVEETDLPDQPVLQSRRINGVEYGEAKIHEVRLFPTVTGELTIPPLNMVFDVQSRQRDPFDDFFNSPFRSNIFGTRRETHTSQAMTIRVKPLPEQGKPADFSGAAGRFEMSAAIENTTVKAGEAMVVRVTLDGRYGLKIIPPPAAPPMENFKLFEPKSGEVQPHPTRPGWSRRTFEYIMVPHSDGDYTIPAFEFSYFDTERERYRILRTEPFDVRVNPAPGGDVIRSDTEGNEIRLLNVDIRYIKTGTGVAPWTEPYRRPWFIGLMVLPFFAVPAVVLVDRRRRRMEGDTAFAREVKARSVSGKRFAEARRLMEEGRVDSVLDSAAAAFAGYLADRLALPVGGVTLGNVKDALLKRQVDPPVITRVEEYWRTLETNRYAPMDTTETAAAELLKQGRALVDDLERIKFKRRTSRRGGRS